MVSLYYYRGTLIVVNSVDLYREEGALLHKKKRKGPRAKREKAKGKSQRQKPKRNAKGKSQMEKPKRKAKKRYWQ